MQVRSPHRAMRLRRLILPAVLLLGIAAALAGCATSSAFRPGTAPDGVVYREFRWPVAGVMGSGFGGRGGRRHDGIDILAREGTPVCAAETGIVTYAGDGLRGYGNAAVLDHGGGATTLYGHLKEIHVQSGDAVARGSVIGTVGRTGNATTSHLHFELRLEGRHVDPLEFLQRTDGPQ